MARKKQQGKHRLRGRPRHVIEMVDTRNGEAHFLTGASAVAAGRRGGGHYLAMCGAEVIPAGLTAPPQRCCTSCRAAIAGRTRR